jgi:Cell division protein CrgA
VGDVPESRRRKKDDDSYRAPNRAVPVEQQHSGRWVPVTASVLLVLGLVWIVVFYVAGSDIAFLTALGNWNLLIGMGSIVLGFLVLTRWK